MPQANLFRWREGGGWLVLAGGGSLDSEDVLGIEAAMLGHTVSQGPIAYIWAADTVDAADRHVDLHRDLGARTGFLVDILAEDEPVLLQQIGEAGIVILENGPHSNELHDALVGSILRAVEGAFERGATVYAIGQSAALFGAYVVQENRLVPGFNWLAHAIILSGYTPDQADALRGWVRQHAAGYGLGLGQGAALALGPRGEVEVWGNAAAITISLGQHYTLA